MPQGGGFMVTVVIREEYLHYANPSLERKCQIINGKDKNAYCSFTPKGINCNVIGLECLDVRNLRFQEDMQFFYTDFYNNAMNQLKLSQQKERKCVEDVSNAIDIVGKHVAILEKHIATAKEYVGGFFDVSFLSQTSPTYDVQEKTKSEKNNVSKQGVSLLNKETYFDVSVHIFVGIFFGEDVYCYNSEEIYLLPPAVIGVAEL
jgi:hypothetical protein